jgi:hypothetical protein
MQGNRIAGVCRKVFVVSSWHRTVLASLFAAIVALASPNQAARAQSVDQQAISEIEQECASQVSASLAVSDASQESARRIAQSTIENFASFEDSKQLENAILGIYSGYDHDYADAQKHLESAIRTFHDNIPFYKRLIAILSASKELRLCAARVRYRQLTGHEYPGANGSAASAPPANLAPPRPNPPAIVAATVPSVPGLNPAVTPLVARTVRQAYDYAPPGWSAPKYRLPRRGGNVWSDQVDAEQVQFAAKGAWIEKRLAANCQNELAAAAPLLSDKFDTAKFDTEVSLAGRWNGYEKTPAEYATYLQPQLQENPPSNEYHKVAAYQICLLKQRSRELDASLVASSYQDTNDQMAEAFQRQREGGTQKLHNHANDATSCLSVVATGTKVEWGASGKFKLVNTCGYPVAASWCANTRDCDSGIGNLWTIGAGKDYPIFFADPAHPDIRVGACRTGAQATNKVDVVANNNGVSMVDTAHDPPQPASGVSIMPGHKCD